MSEIRKWKKFKLSILVLILANLIPLWCVLFWDWQIFQILILYWFETAIIGAFTILKIMFTLASLGEKILGVIALILALGSFMMGHLIFLLIINEITRGGAAEIVIYPRSIIYELSLSIIPIISMTISHGMSFVSNYIPNGEYKKAEVNNLIMAPHARVFAMHFVIILGLILYATVQQSLSILLLFIFIKTLADVIAHTNEHYKFITPVKTKKG